MTVFTTGRLPTGNQTADLAAQLNGKTGLSDGQADVENTVGHQVKGRSGHRSSMRAKRKVY